MYEKIEKESQKDSTQMTNGQNEIKELALSSKVMKRDTEE